ncbi:nitroreductase [Neoasaia chiangmaiensis NBRC 101099]|uniref:NADPH-dependent oxidoreductase n=1 Tax=Neoasaia chiangmaiensis TaxID=320497 RepID=A0A1U9KSF0_9PROT|nr:NADPH-dependent oxidoreductase [Neoasaia chiangmaiensis]AQS88580.1 NADPH-dependent oxidoreductase [Neoasaia chiangmaiensis]GBR36235.1 nitroreductase [Neoasaia chiangmaiensis NBRC 101099]
MTSVDALWQARYRHPAPMDLPDSPVLRALMSHRSVRAYRPDPLPEHALPAAIAAAQSAATSSNLQSWSVIAVKDQARRKRLATLGGNQKHITVAPLFLVWIADLSRLARLATAEGQTHEALDYTESFMTSLIDAALAAQNATVALEGMGLGTVYIGGLRNHPEAVAAELGLPPLAFPAFGLCVGYPDMAHPASIKPRLPQACVLHREQYDPQGENGLIAQYDRDADAFQREQNLPSRAWSRTMIDRIATVAGLHGRDTMRATLARLGFPLK